MNAEAEQELANNCITDVEPVGQGNYYYFQLEGGLVAQVWSNDKEGSEDETLQYVNIIPGPNGIDFSNLTTSCLAVADNNIPYNNNACVQTDVAAVSFSKLGISNQSVYPESFEYLKLHTASGTSRVPASLVSTKAKAFSGTDPVSALSLVTSDILCSSDNNASTVSNVSVISSIQNPQTDVSMYEHEVLTHYVSQQTNLSDPSDIKISWNTFLLPENVLLVKHPLLTYQDRQDLCFYFPFLQEEDNRVSLCQVSTSQTDEGIVFQVQSENINDKFFGQSNNQSSLTMDQNRQVQHSSTPNGIVEYTRHQVQSRMLEQRPCIVSNSNQVLPNPMRVVFSLTTSKITVGSNDNQTTTNTAAGTQFVYTIPSNPVYHQHQVQQLKSVHPAGQQVVYANGTETQLVYTSTQSDPVSHQHQVNQVQQLNYIQPQVVSANNASNFHLRQTVTTSKCSTAVDNTHELTKSVNKAQPLETKNDEVIWERRLPGTMVLCTNCGCCSEDLHYCNSCKKRIRLTAKLVPDPSFISKAAKTEKKTVSAGKAGQHGQKVQQPPDLARKPATKKSKTTTAPRQIKRNAKRPEECIVLSSDEDEDQPKSKILKCDSEAGASSSTTNSTIKEHSQEEPGEASGIEAPLPIHEDGADSEVDIDSFVRDIEEAMGSTPSPLQLVAKIECRSVRIGDYKCVVPNIVAAGSFTVTFTEKGILFSLPHAQHKTLGVKCAIPLDVIKHVEANFKQKMLAIFIDSTITYAKTIRSRLGLSEDPKAFGCFFCPFGGDQYQKRITFLPETVPDQEQAVLNRIFGHKISSIDSPRVNKILVQITRDSNCLDVGPHLSRNKSNKPTKPEVLTTKGVTTETPTPCSNPQPSSQIDISGNKVLLNYEGISICQQDILCLADEQFLNDSIIHFWLRYIEHEILSPEDRSRTYMFSTFFYNRLTTKPKKRTSIEDDPNLSPAEKRHSRVKRWTKNVDIFAKDFLIIPINESLHWFLAVICYPGLLGVHDFETDEPIPDYVEKKPKPVKRKLGGDTNDPTETPSRDEVLNTSEQSSQVNEEEKRKIKRPCILIFDSLVGDSRSRVYSTLREYLRVEYKTRKSEDREFTKTSMPGSMPEVPQQPNHCDCGIYTLYYVEALFQFPISSFQIPINDGKMLWKEPCSTKREDMYASIQNLIMKNHPDNLKWVPKLSFTPPVPIIKSLGGKTKSQIKQQIESALVQTVEKVTEAEEPMDVDVGSSTSLLANSQTNFLQPSTVESARASPTDSNHDHDYAGVPSKQET